LRGNLSYTHGHHAYKLGFESRLNRDSAVFGFGPNGQYTFGGGTSYSPVAILSKSGGHNIEPGQPLPDTLAAFLTASRSPSRLLSPPRRFLKARSLG
jgi:hypothetical protein